MFKWLDPRTATHNRIISVEHLAAEPGLGCHHVPAVSGSNLLSSLRREGIYAGQPRIPLLGDLQAQACVQPPQAFLLVCHSVVDTTQVFS